MGEPGAKVKARGAQGVGWQYQSGMPPFVQNSDGYNVGCRRPIEYVCLG